MSTFLSHARVRSLRSSGGVPRPRLTIVPKVAGRARRIPFTVLVVTVLAGGLVGLLLLNTSLQRGAYTVTDLQQTSEGLALQRQNLSSEVAALQAPQRISERALRLGMVAGDSPAFLSMRTGRVIGVPVAGQRSHRPVVGIPTSRRPPQGAKLRTLVSGEAASQSTGVVTIPSKHSKPGKPGKHSKHSKHGKHSKHDGRQGEGG